MECYTLFFALLRDALWHTGQDIPTSLSDKEGEGFLSLAKQQTLSGLIIDALFRHNVKRIGALMAYEISKTLDYKPKIVTTPLGTIDIPLLKDDMVIATVLRAGLPFHEGFLDVFDKADNGFVSAFRMYINREHTEVGIHTEYIATQSVKNKTLLIVDPMLATGGSLAAAIDSLLQAGKPKKIHLCCIIAAPEGLEVVKEALPEGSTIWCAAVDQGMNEQKYIVPGFGDCGDLCYGEKLQSFRKIADK